MKAQFILGLLSWLFVHPAQALEDLIKNGAFEGTVSQNHWKTSGDIRANSEFENGRNSRGYAYLSQANGAPGNNLSGTIYQEVEVPEDTLTATLIFWHYITTDGTDNSDKLVVSVRSKSGTELKRVTTLYAANKSTTYQQHPGIELAEYAGKTIRIHFEATTDSKVPTTFRIDDVSLLVIRREDDLEAPEILRFYPRESVYKLGEQVVFEYRVRDEGGSGVRTVTLSRSDTTADETHPSWSNLYVAEIEDDGKGDFKIGDFTDTPPVGTYWYTITVEDKAGNRKTASQEGLGPDQVRVKGDEEDVEYPAVTSFEAAQEEATTGTVINILFKAVDEGSGLEFVELYSNAASNDPSDRGWEMRERKTFSGELEVSGEFSVTVKSGSEWFDLRIGDRAGNVRMATEQAISPLRIEGEDEEPLFALEIEVVGQGRCEVSPPGLKFKKGERILLKAIADGGNEFGEWRGALSSRNVVISMEKGGSNEKLRAIFVETQISFKHSLNIAHTTKEYFGIDFGVPEGWITIVETSKDMHKWTIKEVLIPGSSILNQEMETRESSEYFRKETIPDAQPQPFLNFPIPGRNAKSALVTAVMDHHRRDSLHKQLDLGMPGLLTYKDSWILPNTGDVSYEVQNGDDGPGENFASMGDGIFSSQRFNYVGVKSQGEKKNLQYDGHLGYDFGYVGLDVYSAAEGVVLMDDDLKGTNLEGSGIVNAHMRDYHALIIFHEEYGYCTVYMHLKSIDGAYCDSTRDEWTPIKARIDTSRPIGVIGNYCGPCTVPIADHLHFEVWRLDGGKVWRLADPYGVNRKGIEVNGELWK